MSKITLCLGICLFSVVFSGCSGFVARKKIPDPILWSCYYGESNEVFLSDKFKLIILEPDNPLMIPQKTDTVFIGYISLGEAEEFRWYWKKIKDEDFVLEENPDWEGDYYVDIRNPLWQKYVIEKIIPEILRKGFDGLFLDTIDMAEYLEDVDPDKYAGCVDSMVEMIKKIRMNYPDIYLISNNGMILLDKIKGYIDFALVEDLYTSYDFDKNKYRLQTPQITMEMFEIMNDFSKKTGVPVLTLDYLDPVDKKGIMKIMRKSRADGFYPYVADINLLTLPDKIMEAEE